VRTYVEYDTGERELYELQADPHQLENVYSSADPALKTRLSNWLGTLRDAAGAELRAAEESSP
jgi:N-acetylglucosamine-6-sulfatase